MRRLRKLGKTAKEAHKHTEDHASNLSKRIDPFAFTTLFRRRIRFAILLSARICRCGCIDPDLPPSMCSS